MTVRSAGTAAQAARERVDAARALLAHPLLTTVHPEELALVRLHAPALRTTFKTLLGYNLVVESSFARLVKGPVSADAPARPARRADNSTWTAPVYTQLALLCAALLEPGVGEQTLISALIEQVRTDAAMIGVQIGDTLPERRALVAAVAHLIGWGVLAETDGTASGWGERRDEALLTINRSVLPHLLARPLSGLTHPDELLAGDPTLPDQPRRSLRRKLVENPVVRRDDLTAAERDVLSRERNELSRLLEEHFGLAVEVRAEGALAYDSTGSLTDIGFPGGGTVKQAALLLVAELTEITRPGPGTTAALDDGRTVHGFAAGWADVDRALAALAERYRRAWGTAFVEHPQRFRDEVVVLLTDIGLTTVTVTGLVVHPAAGRYRPLAQAAPPTRASRRLSGDHDVEPA